IAAINPKAASSLSQGSAGATTAVPGTTCVQWKIDPPNSNSSHNNSEIEDEENSCSDRFGCDQRVDNPRACVGMYVKQGHWRLSHTLGNPAEPTSQSSRQGEDLSRLRRF